MTQFVDYYLVLCISDLASQSEIKMAYKAMVKKYHPDINRSADATARMQLINEAYLILSDLQAKELYDAERKDTSGLSLPGLLVGNTIFLTVIQYILNRRALLMISNTKVQHSQTG